MERGGRAGGPAGRWVERERERPSIQGHWCRAAHSKRMKGTKEQATEGWTDRVHAGDSEAMLRHLLHALEQIRVHAANTHAHTQ